MNARDKKLKSALDALMQRYGPASLDTDPASLVHRYSRPDDREIVAWISSALAFGGAGQIKRSVDRLLAYMGPHPAKWVRNFRPEREGAEIEPFVHRFVRGRDLACMFHLMRTMLIEEGSLEGFFAKGHSPDAETVRDGLESFSARALALDAGPFYGGGIPPGARVRFLFVSPAGGGACKRDNLFLRWVTRPEDGIDLGLWRVVAPRQLIIPLDTHVGRVSRRMKLTDRRADDWKTAEQITAALRRLDPDDPVRYDFALCRPGILGLCRNDNSGCQQCPLGKVCVVSK